MSHCTSFFDRTFPKTISARGKILAPFCAPFQPITYRLLGLCDPLSQSASPLILVHPVCMVLCLSLSLSLIPSSPRHIPPLFIDLPHPGHLRSTNRIACMNREPGTLSRTCRADHSASASRFIPSLWDAYLISCLCLLLESGITFYNTTRLILYVPGSLASAACHACIRWPINMETILEP